jgi:UDP-N-acetylmuramyl-tripeptide synthetase
VNVRRLVKKFIPRRLFDEVAPFAHLIEAVLYNVRYGFPSRGMKVIGVTGTNGKTTTSFLIHKMLVEAGYKTGIMTTVAYGVNDDIKPQNNHMTTVPVPLLLRRMKWMRAQKIDWLILETTSHALHQHRVWGVPYSVAVFTNLTHEHLDYHKTFENYRAAKVQLFKMTARNRRGLRTGIVNADDPSSTYFAAAVPHVVSYGLKHGDLRAKNIKATTTSSQFTATYKGRELKLYVNLPGDFNVANTLAAVAVGEVLGLSDEQIIKGIGALDGVAGRMETIKAGQDFAVVVDFAVTPDALEKAILALKGATSGKVHVVFGATGDRDKTKRPEMGAIAARTADRIYLTDDETYTENPDAIRDAVYEGIKQAKGEKKTEIIPDRREAIKAAFAAAKKGDSVLIAGMGHFQTRNMGGKEIPWDERQVARELLRARR